MKYQSRKTHAIIDLSALKKNFLSIAALAPKSNTIAVIKANAYGHGAIEVAKSLSDLVPAFAVAFIDEAIILRKAGISSPILILEGPLSSGDFSLAQQYNFWLMLHNEHHLDWLSNLDTPFARQLWIKVDTGMNRLGFSPKQVVDVIAALSTEQQKSLVLCSHFSNAEERENPKTLEQISILQKLTKQFHCQSSLANSAGIINWPQSHRDYNRSGIALYGATPVDTKNLSISLDPVMTLQSSIIGLRKLAIDDCVGYGETWQAKRPTLIATIAIGYADGYPRNAPNGTPVLINGQQAPLVGEVSMDMITVDVTDMNKVQLGDQVELWGKNLRVETIAKQVGTINYELITRVSARVPKTYMS